MQYLLQIREGGFIICGIFIAEKAKLFSNAAGAGVFKTRYG